MTSLARALGSAAANRSNLIVTGLVLLLVAGLFFIPELVDFQRTIGGKSSTAKPATAPVAVKSATIVSESAPGTDKESSLAQLAALVESGYIDRLRDEAAAKRAAASGRPFVIPGASESEIRAAKVFSKRPLAWADLRDPDASGYLNQARGRTQEIFRSITDATPQTRLALLNFLSGLQFVLQGGDGVMETEPALKWLESLDNSVTKAMVQEGIERATFMQWRQVSIGLALQGSRAVRLKQQYYLPFNPRLNITAVRMRKPGDGTGRFIDDEGPVSVDMVGFVTGRDIEKVELFLDGQHAGEILLGNVDEHGRRRFTYMLGDARLRYTFRIVDRYGESYERSYAFYPRVRRFGWKNGAWVIPTARSVEDPSIDRIFRSYSSASGASNRIYEVF